MKNFENPSDGSERIPSTKLSDVEIKDILDKFKKHNLKLEGEYFVYTNKDGSETHIHTWDQIPIGDDQGNIVDRKPIKQYLEERLEELNESGTENNGENKKEAA